MGEAVGSGMFTRRPWSADEMEYLRQHWVLGSKEEILNTLQRSWGSIRQKAKRMELPERQAAKTFGVKVTSTARPPDIAYLEKEIRRLRGLLAKADVQSDIFRAFLREALKGYEPSPYVYTPPTEPKKHEKEEVAVATLSDTHYAAIVRPATVGGLSRYNRGIFVERLDMFRESILECVEIQRRSVTLNDLYIVGLGDYVEGEGTYLGQAWHTDVPMLRQIVELGDLVPQRLLSPLCSHFRHVYLMGVAGNHAKAKDSPSNWDLDAMWHWQLRMEKHKNFRMHIEWDKIWTMFRVLDWPWNFFAAHGNQVRAWQGNFPSYGVERMFARYIGMLNLPINYLFMGHHHQQWHTSTLWGANFFSGSFVGGSQYSHDKMMKIGRPEQWLVCMNEDHVTSTWPLVLDKLPELYFNEKGILTYVGAKEDALVTYSKEKGEGDEVGRDREDT